MRTFLMGIFKKALTNIGARLSEHRLHRIQMVANYMKLGRWMQENNFTFPKRVKDRELVFADIARRIQNERVLYLEFGVYQGESMRYWSNMLKNPESRLHGFDSFEGLPEDFCVGGGYVKGRFYTGGIPPIIEDPRVKFFKGWFEETLPHYTLPDHDVLVICLDADLYSSTIYVLRTLRRWISKGTFIYFDEMSRPEHEPKAFKEFMDESGLTFLPICADQSLNRAFFECNG
jgi:hypothetical protein